ncbi:hypothetical protein CBS101457_001685 [Exobasidium rhododendri]|nr:hypothetical protein CBS101457_001685 [Exobasidium rhododendri]
MPTSGDHTPSSSILDHYSGIDAVPSPAIRPGKLADLQRESEFSANGSTASSTLGGVQEGKTYINSPHLPPSVRSSSSSLRNTVALLKGGVYPPGIQQRRRAKLDSDSDASHYDDDEDQGFEVIQGEGEGPFQPGTPLSRDALHEAYEQEYFNEGDIYSNAQDSPSVPRRVSSAEPMRPRSPQIHHSRYAEEVANTKGSEDAAIESGAGEGRMKGKDLSTASIPPRVTSTQEKSEAIAKRAGAEIPSLDVAVQDLKVNDTSSTTDSAVAVSPGKEKILEMQLSAESDDPNRPRTLKEARAMAKERAQLRLQAKHVPDVASSGRGSVSPNKATAFERPTRALRRNSVKSDRSLSEYSANSAEEMEGIDGHRLKDSVNWKKEVHARQRAVPVTPMEEQGTERQLASSSYVVEDQNSDLQRSPTTMAMEELQSAVGAAIQDIKLTSPIKDIARLPFDTDVRGYEPLAKSRLEIPSRDDAEIESSTHSATSFDSARESFAVSSIISTAVPSWAAHEDVPNSFAELPRSTEHTPTLTSDSTRFSPSAVSLSTSQFPPSIDVITTDRFVPHALHTQQRSTAPNKIARLDVYGKTVPWPPAFNPAAIIDQRRLAPWERARSYAYYCNDLAATASGLSVWIEMVQRPAQRVVPEPATPVKRQFHSHRKEGTDHSSYAASVRSDATFPIRGDGGKAKDMMFNVPSTINESPSNILPNNIPYPVLVHQQSHTSSSSQEGDAISSSNSSLFNNNDRERSVGLGRSGNFFTSLGRKGSTRRTPGSGSIGGFSALTSNSALRGRSKTSISSPTTMNTSPSLPNTKVVITKEPESISSSPSLQAATTPRSHQTQSSPSHSTQSTTRAPMGPRAPLSGGLPFSVTSGSRRLSTNNVDKDRTAHYDASTTGGTRGLSVDNSTKLSLPPNVNQESSTDYSGEAVARKGSSPLLNNIKSSFAYNSAQERSPRLKSIALQPPMSIIVPERRSSDSNRSKDRRNSQAVATSAEIEALNKLSDVLPDAERSTLLEYLRRANGNDLIAIGDYLQAQSKVDGRQRLR